MDTIIASNFNFFNFSQQTISNLNKKGITEPTAVQKQVIPAIQEGKNVIFESETGTGKTLAYLLPLLQNIQKDSVSTCQTDKTIPPVIKLIILSPTHELASQIKTEIQSITDLKCCLFIGASPIKRQIELLKEKPVIAAGSPSRILELIRLKKMKTANVSSIVLDEVDRLLSPELRDDTCALLESMPSGIQMIACSATIPLKAKTILESHMPQKASKEEQLPLQQSQLHSQQQLQPESETKQDIESSSGLEKQHKECPPSISFIKLPQEDVLRYRITHWAFYAEERDKTDLLRRFIIAEKPQKVLVFTSKVSQVEQIASRLSYKGIDCLYMSAKSDKTERKAAIDKFRNGKCSILITSDLAARGLDISGITHIVQMDFPSNTDFFIHRAGRTGRAGKTGINVVIGDAYEMRKYADLEKKLGITVYPKELYGGKILAPENNTIDKSAEI